MAGRRARTGRGWDAAPPRARRNTRTGSADADGTAVGEDTNPPDGPGESGGPGGSDGPGESGGRRKQREKPPKPPLDPYEQAREICLRQLSFRPRTRAELAAALRKHEIDDEVAAAVLDRYSEVGLINDEAFAKAWVTTRHHGRGLARRALANELRQRGVDSEVVDSALDDLDHDTESATARTLVDRKLRSMGSAPPDAVFRRLAGMLARKGYPSGVVMTVVKEALAERAASAEFAEALDPDAYVE